MSCQQFSQYQTKDSSEHGKNIVQAPVTPALEKD